jgi:hypothetical protein
VDYAVACPCGNQIEVRVSQAGSQVQCACGQIVDIPALSQLRHVAGQSKYEVHIVDKVRQMVSDARLPNAQTCIQCEAATQKVAEVIVECQRPRFRGNGYLKTLFLTLIAPVWALREVQDECRNPEVIGAELILRAPIRLCSACSSKLGKRQRRLRRLLPKEPVYEELLREYPNAQIHVPRQ